MLFFVGTRFHAYTLDALRRTACNGHDVLIVPIDYQDLFAAEEIPGGTWLFTDLERLSAHERLLTASIFREMASRPDLFRPINDPARARMRFGMLRHLHAAGLNGFEAYRASGLPRPRRFPVFVKSESNHQPMVTDLLADQAALEAALEALEASGHPLDGLVVIEFAAEPVRPGVWVRYTAFRIGDDILPDLPVTEAHWMVKDGQIGLGDDAMYAGHDRMIREAHHTDVLRQAFDLARIGYGRVDFGLVNGRPQIYEINTNPNFVAPEPLHPNAVRQATREFCWDRLTTRLAAMADGHGTGQVVPLDTPLLREYRIRGEGSGMGWRP